MMPTTRLVVTQYYLISDLANERWRICCKYPGDLGDCLQPATEVDPPEDCEDWELANIVAARCEPRTDLVGYYWESEEKAKYACYVIEKAIEEKG